MYPLTTLSLITTIVIPTNQVSHNPILISHMDVFSDLLDNIMYSVIKRDNVPSISDTAQGVEEKKEMAREKERPGRELRSRRRVLRRKEKVPMVRMKTREKEKTKPDQTENFFRSKKIVSRQRSGNTTESEGRGESSKRQTGEKDRSNTAREELDIRLQKVKELFQLIKVSKANKMRSQARDRNVKSKFLNFPVVRSGQSLSSPLTGLVTGVETRARAGDTRDKVEALEALYEVAGTDWVESNIEK